MVILNETETDVCGFVHMLMASLMLLGDRYSFCELVDASFVSRFCLLDRVNTVWFNLI
jgi:hypothetical protein